VINVSTREERYLEWLERERLPPEALATISTLRDFLMERAHEAGLAKFPYSAKQIRALYQTAQIERKTLAELGIRAVYQPRYVRHPYRYLIKGRPGFWGIRSVRTLLERAFR
jgi:hypothetical protein